MGTIAGETTHEPALVDLVGAIPMKPVDERIS
jgi:hypothetical protein